MDQPDLIDQAIGFHIRLRRRELQISQGKLGECLGVSFQQIQKYERGSNRVSGSMLVKAARALRCSVAYLVGEAESPETVSSVGILTPDGLDLLQSFLSIPGLKERRAVVALARALASAAPP